ncbi:hypothetical protein K492DRAFT_190958 [Lichtheimia hyalospora FSU 10163]|nr:hypothetical protein K492DRAFT_190958 [Lichtheimia hyalospora FSU 10163]
MSHFYNHHDDGYYGQYNTTTTGPPPPPPHQPYYDNNNYPMYDMPTQYNSPTPATDDVYGLAAKSSAKQHGEYQNLGDPGDTAAAPIIYTEKGKKRSCLDKLCCGCCTCYPRWARWLFCILLLLVIILAIIIGVLAALFKVPEVKFNGLKGEPKFSLNGTTATFEFNLDITIDNPNIESVTFENAYYPGYSDSIGGGTLDNVHISNNAVTEIIFPFHITVDAMDHSTQAILFDIMGKCGLTGNDPSGITINYDIVPTLDIIGIKISPTISNQATLPCDDAKIPDLSSITSLTSLIPSDIVDNLPTDAIPSDIAQQTSLLDGLLPTEG